MKKRYVALVAQSCPDCAEEILSEYARVIRLPCESSLRESVSCHPDMILTAFRSRLYIRDSYYRDNSALIKKICSLCALTPVRVPCNIEAYPLDYPLDCALNALVLEDRDLLIGRRKSLASALVPLSAADTNQGYAGCTALYCAGCIISADKSMLRAAELLGVEGYTLPAGKIMLPGYDTGFIGGCGGVLHGEDGTDTLFVYGSPDYSDTGIALSKFCRLHSVKLVSLCEGELFDRGGIKFLPEREL